MSIIEIEQLEQGTNKVKDAPKIIVRASDCYHPTSYGRDISRHHVNRLAAVFDYKKLGEITIAEIPTENGRYEINDGNHRHQALISKFGVDVEFTATLLPPGLTLEQRAQEYTARNRARTPMKPVDLFRADVIRRDPDALEIKRVCEEAGVGIIDYNTKTKTYPNIASFRDLYGVHRAGNLEKVLHIIRSAYDGVPLSYSKGATTAYVLRPVNKFLVLFRDNNKFKETRLIDTLKKYHAQYWIGAAMKEIEFSPEGVGALLKEYNKKLTNAYRLHYSIEVEEKEIG